MKKITNILLMLFLLIQVSFAQKNPESTEVWEPVPAMVTPAISGLPPSDAIVLFNGEDLSNFLSTDSTEAAWKVTNDYMTVIPGTKSIRTKQKFGDCQLHVEWLTPVSDTNSGQGKGNSGIYLMELYEVQVLDSWENETYSNGQAASIYKQHIPLVNASKKPDEWQSYDIIFTAPKLSISGSVISPARMTVLHNGILVQNNVSLLGPTEYIGMPAYKVHGDKEPLMIQNHGDSVSFRNIWIREL
ncbi:MAG: DUF1080 domain-containing protein [Bacteroidales bacterium]|nr:DUF1080 domain-containing protein [Bacteroidales bacterium]